ncbi:MAG: MFS transporter [Verrucomicrobiota bacterium]
MQTKPQDDAQLTYRYDCWRAAFLGICEAGWVTFGLLIVIRGFGADDESWSSIGIKSLITSAGFVGLLLTSLSLSFVSRSRLPATRAISIYLVLAGAMLLAASSAGSLYWFAALFVVANIISAQQAPLMAETYAINYESRQRGKRVSTVIMIIAFSSVLFSAAGGWLLDTNFDWFPGILIAMAVACFINAFWVRKIPSKPLASHEVRNPLRNFSLIWSDKVFGWLLGAKMLMGLANFMTLPIRVEVLADPRYGINASNEQVALATVILPSIAKIVSSKFWGALFDRWNYIPWRIAVNACFIVGILLFFTGSSLPVIYLGALLVGFGMGGSLISWNLWITKIVDSDKVSAYMSVHTTLTGIRGILAPFLGYVVLLFLAPTGLAIVCALSIGLSSLMYARMWNHECFRFRD